MFRSNWCSSVFSSHTDMTQQWQNFFPGLTWASRRRGASPLAAVGWCTAAPPSPVRTRLVSSSSPLPSAPTSCPWVGLRREASWVLCSRPRPVGRDPRLSNRPEDGCRLNLCVWTFTCWNCAGIGLAYGTFFWGTFLASFPMTSSMPQSSPGMDISTSGAASLPADDNKSEFYLSVEHALMQYDLRAFI